LADRGTARARVARAALVLVQFEHKMIT
jgi:hypothetical protein